MNTVFKSVAFTGMLAALTLSSGCRKQLDVNTNPNIATEVTPDLLLPSAEVNLGVAMGVDIHTTGSFWAEYWTQSPTASQYKDLEQYQPTGNDFDREWAQFYSGTLMDLKKMIQSAESTARPQYIAIGKLLMAYSFQVITDGWGDIPYTQALKGELTDGQILNPQYDPQSLVYDSLIAMTDQALALINPADTRKPATDDVIFGGNMTSWRHFGNTLKLKLYMRLSEVAPDKARTGLTATLAGGGFLTATENAMVTFVATAGNRNPLSGEITALNYTQNQVASATAIDSLNRNNDPRVAFFYDIAVDAICNPAGYIGLRQGDYNQSPSLLLSAPGAITGANANLNCNSAAVVASRRAPVRFLMGYESLFLQAEAMVRTGASGADSMFRAAIRANFTHVGSTAAAANGYIASSYWGRYPTGGSAADQIRHIVTQKWFAMTGIQGFEAWTEFRRTGYPSFLVPSVNSFLGNNFPKRFPYPNTELTRNSNFPGQKPLTDRVYWDIN